MAPGVYSRSLMNVVGIFTIRGFEKTAAGTPQPPGIGNEYSCDMHGEQGVTAPARAAEAAR
jgi:hypothetical protein